MINFGCSRIVVGSVVRCFVVGVGDLVVARWGACLDSGSKGALAPFFWF